MTLNSEISEKEKSIKYLNDEITSKQNMLNSIENTIKTKQEDILIEEAKLQKLNNSISETHNLNELLEELRQQLKSEEKLKDSLKENFENEKKKYEELLGNLQNSISQKDTIIADQKSSILTTQAEIQAKSKEIELLKSENEKLQLDCNLAISFNLITEENNEKPDILTMKIQASEIENLKLNVQNLENSLKISDLNYKSEKQRADDVKNESMKILIKNEELTKTVKSKSEILETLENINKNLEGQIASLIAEKKNLEKKLESSIQENSTKMQEYEELVQKTNEMRGEIEILITQCKEARNQMKQQDLDIKKYQNNIEEMDVELKQKNIEIDRREQHIDRLSKQLNEKKNQLHMSNLKMQELNKTVLGEYKQKLAEKERDIVLYKEMIKGHHGEVLSKNRELQKLRKEIQKLKAEKGSEKVDPVENKEENEKKESELAEKMPDLRPSQKTPVNNSSDPASIPVYPPVSEPQYKEKYLKKLEDYYNAINDHNYRNNSSGIRNVLWHNYNVSPPKNMDSPIRHDDISSKITDSKHSESFLQISPPRKANPYDLDINVEDIIKKSINSKKEMSVDSKRQDQIDILMAKHSKSKGKITALTKNLSPLVNKRIRVNNFNKRGEFT